MNIKTNMKALLDPGCSRERAWAWHGSKDQKGSTRTERLGHMTYQSRGCGKGEQKMAETRIHGTDGKSGTSPDLTGGRERPGSEL